MIEIRLAHNSVQELNAKRLLIDLISEHSLDRFEFTRIVIIDEESIPHSHPILTLHTRHLNQPGLLLSTYLHEQLHWFVEGIDSLELVIAELREKYKHVPVGRPEGAKSEYSTYLHLIVNLLEYLATKKVLGDKVEEVFNFWEQDHYTWIYKTVRTDMAELTKLLKANNLIPELLTD